MNSYETGTAVIRTEQEEIAVHRPSDYSEDKVTYPGV
jgi:hypothetical protein